MKKSFMMAVVLVLVASPAMAGQMSVPNTFTAGTPALAAQVNANFTAAKTAVDDNDARITTNAATAATNTANITTNAAAIATNASAIAVIQGAALVRTITVSPVIVGGAPDPIQSGTALLAAVAGITTASATNRYLIKLEPGVYDLGASTITLPPFVGMDGSGSQNTVIVSTPSPGFYVLTMSTDTHINALSVTSTETTNPSVITTVGSVSNIKINRAHLYYTQTPSNGGNVLTFKPSSTHAAITINNTQIDTPNVGLNTAISLGSFYNLPPQTYTVIVQNSQINSTRVTSTLVPSTPQIIIANSLVSGALGSAVGRCAGTYDRTPRLLTANCQ